MPIVHTPVLLCSLYIRDLIYWPIVQNIYSERKAYNENHKFIIDDYIEVVNYMFSQQMQSFELNFENIVAYLNQYLLRYNYIYVLQLNKVTTIQQNRLKGDTEQNTSQKDDKIVIDQFLVHKYKLKRDSMREK